MANYMQYPQISPSAPSSAGSPYQHQFQQSPVQLPPAQNIQPGAMTYTTSMGPDGRPVYHAFRAEAASYRSEQGIIPGIQWVPVETYDQIPRNAQPASMDWIQRWGRDRTKPHEEREWREWLKHEEKRARREAKESRQEFRDMEKAEEKYQKRMRRERERAVASGLPVYSNYGYGGQQPAAMAGGYLATGDPNMMMPQQRERRLSQSTADIDRRMAELELASGGSGHHHRRKSMSSRSGGRERRVSFNTSDRPSGLVGNYVPADGRQDFPGGFGDPSMAGQYPPGHIMALNQPAGMGGPISDRASPNYAYSALPPAALQQRPGGLIPSPYQQQAMQQPNQFGMPDGFNRMPDAIQNYNTTAFEPMLITHMDDILREIPRLPAVVAPHDVNHQDWIKFMQDLARAWSGQVVFPDQRTHVRRSAIAANLIDTWNSAFFLPRYLEVVLVKGRTRYSGPTAGHIDPRLVRAVEEVWDEEDSSSSSESDGLDDEYERGYGMYGGAAVGNQRWMTDTAMARREWKLRRKEEKKMKERIKRKEKERRHKRFSLYVMCVR